VISLALGVLLDFAIGPYAGKGTGEHGLLRQLMGVFNAGDVVLGDCYYASFFLIATFIKMEIDVVFPIHSARNYDFRSGKRLGKKDHVIEWKKPAKPEWMDQTTYDDYPLSIPVRETKITNKRTGFRLKSRVIVSTFIDACRVTPEELGRLYDFRWLVEINLRAIKDTMRMDVLRSKSPPMVRKEIWAHLLAYNLIRKTMAQAAFMHDKKPQELSFKLAMQLISVFRQAGILFKADGMLHHKLLKEIVYKKVGNRPGRTEPRRVKRRPKSFPLLQKPRNFYHKKKAA